MWEQCKLPGFFHHLLWQWYKTHSSCWYRLAKRFWWIHKSFKSCSFINIFPFEPKTLHNRWQSLHKSGIRTRIIWKQYWYLGDASKKEWSVSKSLAMQPQKGVGIQPMMKFCNEKFVAFRWNELYKKSKLKLFQCCCQYMLLNWLTQEKLFLLRNKTS